MPEQIQITVEIQNVKKDDVFSTDNLSNIPYGARVHGVDAKIKWVTIDDADGNKVVRLERGAMVQVLRSVKTDEERAAERREAIVYNAERRVVEWTRDTLTSALQKALDDGDAGHWTLDRIIEGEARRKVRVQLNHFLQRAETLGFDALTACIVTIEYMTKRTSSRSPLSRSTSITSNLDEDMERWAIEKFTEDILAYGLVTDEDRVRELAKWTAAVDADKAARA